MEYKESFGAVFSPKDFRDYRGVCCVADFPDKFELEMPDVKNQGAVGSCVAHSLATVIEYYNRDQANMTDKMSVGFIYGNRENSTYKGRGMVVRDAIGSVCDCGDVQEEFFKDHYEVPRIIETFEGKKDNLYSLSYPFRFSAYFALKTENDIKACLMNHQPVVFAMRWYSDIKVIEGVMTTLLNETEQDGSHCMVIYGWNEQGWKIQNSWGTSWGDDGRAILPYNVPIQEAWGITDNIIDSEQMEIKKPFSSQIGSIIAKILNLVIRIIDSLTKK